jgi:two-component system, NtrC family, sensor kinase
MKQIILLILTIFLQPALPAQKKGQARTDSLVRIIKTTMHDTARILALNTLGTDLYKVQFDTAVELSSSALQIAQKINYVRGEADSYFSLGQMYANKPTPPLALQNFENALKLYETLKKPQWIAEACYAIGRVYERSNYDVALQYFRKALQAAQQSNIKNLMGKVAYILAVTVMRKGDYNQAPQYNDLAIRYYTEAGNETGLANCYIASARINNHAGNYQQSVKDNYTALRLYERTGNKVGIYNVHTGLGLMYEDQKNYREALKSYQLAKTAAEEFGNKDVLWGAYNNVGNAYRDLGNMEGAVNAFTESLKLSELVGDKKGIATALGNLGTIYSRTGRPTEALESYDQAKKLFEEVGAKESIAISYFESGQLYYEMKKPAESKQSLETALQISKQIGYKDLISKSYQVLTQIDSSAGDYISALEHYKLYITYRDSVSNAEAAKQLIEQRMQYAFSKKEDSLQLQQELIADKLEKQTLLTKQQQQDLRLKQASLELARREKDVQMLNFLRTQAVLQLSNEQQEKKLTLAEQERALQQSQIEKQRLLSIQKEQTLLLKDKELSAQRSQRNFWVAGAIALFLLSFFVFLNYRNQRKANAELQEQQTKTEQALKKLKSTQAQLIQSEKMASLGGLTAGIAHEIQNPLNFVNNFSDVNQELIAELKEEIDKGNTEEVKALANDLEENEQKINHHGKRADAIVKGMLQHSRSSTGKKEPTDINALADEYLRLAYNGLRAKDKDFNADFKTDYDETIGKIEVVPQDIGRVLLNLYNNAFYSVNEKKKLLNGSFEPIVTVGTKRVKDKIEVSVKDNGVGIPQKALDKIFQPFFTTKPTGQGTGLGLSLSYDIITKGHGGQLTVDTKEGEYAKFAVQLPLG